MSSYIDAHAHYQQESTEIAIQRLRFASTRIQKIALGGADSADWKKQVQLQHQFPENIYTHFGLHPWWVGIVVRNEIEKILLQLDY